MAERKAASRCSKCHRPVRKGESVMVEYWATAGGVEDGRRALRPYLGVLLHQRCVPPWTRERKARALAALGGEDG